MTAYQLPALRVNRAQAIAADVAEQHKIDREALREILTAFVDTLEEGAGRWGNACPGSGCHQVVQYEASTRGYRCPKHGWMQYARLLVAWDPVTD